MFIIWLISTRRRYQVGAVPVIISTFRTRLLSSKLLFINTKLFMSPCARLILKYVN
jgi:hypothetical protein